MTGKKLRPLLAAGAVSAAAACVALLAGAGSALACVQAPDGSCFRPNYHVQRTDGSLAAWSAPGTGRIVGWLDEGTGVDVVCETTGPTEDGLPYIVWDKLDDGTYVYGYYLDTPGDGFHPALTLCPGAPGTAPTPAPLPNPAPTPKPAPSPNPAPHPPAPSCPATGSVPQPPGSGPQPGSGPRPGRYIDHAQWSWVRYQVDPVRCGWSLQVTPTLFARLQAGSGLAAQLGWNELYSDYRNVGRGIKHNLDGLKKQYFCHQQIVAFRAPRKPTWDIDEWRPDVSYLDTIRASCNPS